MSKNAIDVDHVSIRFNLANEKINNLKEYAIKLAKHELMFQEFLALKDVSLHVKRGEAWGLIGTNGSGKSTLLKTIAGILKPYTGTVKVRGSIAPMIELGAGFDAELTARENIFLNGAVLGHPREFMQRHFDEIVDFAGVRNFLDSPVKNFSSGMKGGKLTYEGSFTIIADHTENIEKAALTYLTDGEVLKEIDITKEVLNVTEITIEQGLPLKHTLSIQIDITTKDGLDNRF